jgi:hypothetical protein
MSTTARKLRKAAGLPFVKAAKVGTPLLERPSFLRLPLREQITQVEARGIELTDTEQGELASLDVSRRNVHRANSGYIRNYTR